MITKEQFLQICEQFREVRRKTHAINDAGVDLIEVIDPLYGVTNILGEEIFGKALWGCLIDWIWEGWNGKIYSKNNKLACQIKTDEELYDWLKQQRKKNNDKSKK